MTHPLWIEYGADADGNIYSFRSGKPKKMNPAVAASGYLVTNIKYRELGVKQTISVHRFVLESHTQRIGTPDEYVCHGDGSKLNNKASNLRWCTASDNTTDMHEHRRSTLAELKQEVLQCVGNRKNTLPYLRAIG